MNQKNHSFDFSRYFRHIAVHLKDVAHSPISFGEGQGVRKFHRVSGITQLEVLLHNLVLTTDDGYQLVIEDNLDSRFLYNAATLLDEQYYVFYVIKRCRVSDFDAIEQVKEGCKTVAKKIFSKLFRDHEADWKMQSANTNGLRGFQKKSITIQTIGPLADQHWGLMCSFTIADNPAIHYDPADWLT